MTAVKSFDELVSADGEHVQLRLNITIAADPIFVLRVSNVAVPTQGTFAFHQNFRSGFMNAVHFFNRKQQQPTRSEFGSHSLVTPPPRRTAMYFADPWGGNFQHWWFDLFPQLWFYRQLLKAASNSDSSASSGDGVIIRPKLLCSQGMYDYQFEALAIMGVRNEDILVRRWPDEEEDNMSGGDYSGGGAAARDDQNYAVSNDNEVFDALYVPGYFSGSTIVDIAHPSNPALSMLDEFRERIFAMASKSSPPEPESSSSSPERILITRRDTSESAGRLRVLQNEDALISALTQLGTNGPTRDSSKNFRAAEVSRLSLTARARFFKNCKFVVMLQGAAMANVVFVPPAEASCQWIVLAHPLLQYHAPVLEWESLFRHWSVGLTEIGELGELVGEGGDDGSLNQPWRIHVQSAVDSIRKVVEDDAPPES
jgi:hypothetical protein